MRALFSTALAIAAAAVETTGDYYGSGHYHGHGHSHTHGYGYYHPNTSYDPWATTTTTTSTTTGWYSPYQQYSPPKIAYKPGPMKLPEYAICELSNGTQTATVQIAQYPHRAASAKVTLAGFTASRKIDLTINQYGDIYTTTTNTCDNTGTEYRPLQEKDKYNQNNPYQDPARGRLPYRTLTTSATGALAATTTNNLLLNLTGDDSIIGRSILFYEMDATGKTRDAVPKGCCVIAIDVNPNPLPTNYPAYNMYGKYQGYGSTGATGANHGHRHGTDYGTHAHHNYKSPQNYGNYGYNSSGSGHGHSHGTSYGTHKHDNSDYFKFPSSRYEANKKYSSGYSSGHSHGHSHY